MPDSASPRDRLPALLAAGFEGSLILVALALGAILGVPILATVHLEPQAVGIGLAGTIPLLLLFPVLVYSRWPPLRRIREILDSTLLPLLADCSIAELGVISLLAGIGEEMLFRAFLQGCFAEFVGPVPALFAAAVLFGLAHMVTVAYAAIAGTIGVYLGWWWIASGNLLVPITIHSAYDFVGLVYLLHRWRMDSPGSRGKNIGDDAGGEPPLFTNVADHSRRVAEFNAETTAPFVSREAISMKAAYIEKPGPASDIQFGELPTPSPQGSQVLVRVEAVSVNPIDTYIRSGVVAMPLPLPFIVGCDLAGTVDAVGPEVKRFKRGDRVWGSNQGLFGRQGTFAEFACVEEEWLYPLPAGVDAKTAAALALVGITAYLGLVTRARLQAGEWLFVNGGSGGVGSTVVQIAKAIGAKIITTAGSDEKVAQCRSLGADVAINYRQADVDQAIKDAAPTGVNVWWETLREPSFERAIPLLAKRGRMVVMAGRDAKPVFPVGAFYTKDCAIHGFAMFNAAPAEQSACAADLGRWMAEGKLRANIGVVMPLSQAAQAHQLQEENTLHKSGTLQGKIVLTPG